MFIQFPVEFPDDFFTGLGTRIPDVRFFAVYYDSSTNLVLREDGVTIFSCPEEKAWNFFIIAFHPMLHDWLIKKKIDLNSGKHWLVHDTETSFSYAVDPETAKTCLISQTLPLKENNHESSRNPQSVQRRA